jgi:hypothetical protein
MSFYRRLVGRFSFGQALRKVEPGNRIANKASPGEASAKAAAMPAFAAFVAI